MYCVALLKQGLLLGSCLHATVATPHMNLWEVLIEIAFAFADYYRNHLFFLMNLP